MDPFHGHGHAGRNGQPQTWIRAGSVIRTDRVVDSVEGDRVTLDVPLSDALDSKFTAASLVRYSFPGRITEVGVEGLRIAAPFEDVPIRTAIHGASHGCRGGRMGPRSRDSGDAKWNRDRSGRQASHATNVQHHTLGGAFGLRRAGRFCAAGNSDSVGPLPPDGRRYVAGGYAGGGTGPLVVLNFTADHGGVAPHQRWGTGLLVDGGKFPGGTERRPGLAFSNRATAGSGHGWDIGWAVAWNVSSPFLLVQQPPGALNWCIGCIGKPVTIGSTPNGIFDSPGKMVEPASLYLHQLRDRLGPDALRNIGY